MGFNLRNVAPSILISGNGSEMAASGTTVRRDRTEGREKRGEVTPVINKVLYYCILLSLQQKPVEVLTKSLSLVYLSRRFYREPGMRLEW